MDRMEQSLFRLEQGFELQFRLGSTLQGKDVHIYTNYPTSSFHTFNSLEFHPLDWIDPSGKEDDCEKYCRLDLRVAGSFQYYFCCGGNQKVSSGYIVVDPVLRVGANDAILPLDCICCQSYSSRRLGPLNQWINRLRVSKETGYNMIHLSPLQKLGMSGSCYCIEDQLELNPDFSPEGEPCTWSHIGNLVDTLRSDWGMLCITDVVYSHTAVTSEWIQTHPECGYNLVNSPHLKPAWLLDRALWQLSCEVADGKYVEQGIPALIQDQQHINALRDVLWRQVFSRLRLWEFLQVNVDESVNQFRQLLQAGDRGRSSQQCDQQLKTIQDYDHKRFGKTVDMNSALDIFTPHSDSTGPSDLTESCEYFRRTLEEMNQESYQEMNGYADQAIRHILEGVVHERFSDQGPKLGPITRTHPLCPRYFVFPFPEITPDEEEQLIEQKEKACHVMAHDGFVKGKDPLQDIAGPDSQAYLKRELLCESDTIKLRYGQKQEDCPYLWARMKTYTEITANVFSGVCLVNCLSLPLHVSEAMLTAARAIRPNLYVTAEISTGSQMMDNVFVNCLGITSLMRDAWRVTDSQLEGGWLACFGKEPVGAFVQPNLRPLTSSVAPTMFMDMSPNNHSSIQKHPVYDLLPQSALVSMSCCATGSIRGHDELLPLQMLEQREDHRYTCWSPETQTCDQVNLQTGILAGKLELNRLHQELTSSGFTQGHVEQLFDSVVITRHCPSSHQSVVAVLRRAAKHPETPHNTDYVPPVFIPGQIKEVLLEALTITQATNSNQKASDGHTVEIKKHIQLKDSEVAKSADVVSKDNSVGHEIVFAKFPPGSIIIFGVTLDDKSQEHVGALRHHLTQFSPQYQTGSLPETNPPDVLINPLSSIMSRLTLADMNFLLFRCDAEEREEGGGCYKVPSWSQLNYGGLQGVMSVMAEIRPKNDLSHPLCDNLKKGDWMMDYISNRLMAKGGALGEVGQWFQAMFGYLKAAPRYLVPSYFDSIVRGAYTTALETLYKHMSSFVQNGPCLVKQLALGSVQMFGASHSVLPRVSRHLKDVLSLLSEDSNQGEVGCVSLAAGLPYCCTGVLRCWGRDTFISLRGLLLLTGRHPEARNIILAFAGTLRHGLIPNLLGRDGDPKPRYNCRDAVWWWLHCVQEYCSLVPNGVSILKCPVPSMHPNGVGEPESAEAKDWLLYDVIQEVMQSHMQGIQFREADAGPQLDNNMTNEGFNVEAGVNHATGFVYGGNRFNCGTWMDKIGESERAHNKGIPATPRDGSAVEMVGLCKSTVQWLMKLYNSGDFPYAGVNAEEGGQTNLMSYMEWDRKIQENFEMNFHISLDQHDAEEKQPHLVHKRGIYKDSVGASSPWCDYQLRPNFPVAMVVAPELFTVVKAWEALSVAERVLLGPMGMKTLDPDDMMFCGVYNKNLDNDIFNQAKGYNYHQGPEWVWPLGYFLRAKLYFAKKMGEKMYEDTVHLVRNILSCHAVYLERSPWKGLPELFNDNGQHCPFSCESQASSIATILEVLYDL